MERFIVILLSKYLIISIDIILVNTTGDPNHTMPYLLFAVIIIIIVMKIIFILHNMIVCANID